MSEELYIKGPVTPIIPETPETSETILGTREIPEDAVKMPINVKTGLLVLTYIVTVIFAFIIPDLAGFLFWVILLLGLFISADFINILFRQAGKDKYHPAVKLFLGLVAVGGGVTIFIISFIIGVTGYFAANPIQGD